MKKTYDIKYDFVDLAIVSIDHTPETEAVLKEMVEFWMDWETTLDESNGSYTFAWLRQLGQFLIRHHRVPRNDEGWCLLDGTHGINVLKFFRWSPDPEAFEVTEIA